MDYHNFPLFSRPLVIGYDNIHTHSEEKCYGQLSALSSERTCRSIIPVYPKSNRSRKGLAQCQVSIKGKDKRVREHKAWLQGGTRRRKQARNTRIVRREEWSVERPTTVIACQKSGGKEEPITATIQCEGTACLRGFVIWGM